MFLKKLHWRKRSRLLTGLWIFNWRFKYACRAYTYLVNLLHPKRKCSGSLFIYISWNSRGGGVEEYPIVGNGGFRFIFSYSPSILQPLVQKTISIKQANLEQILNLLFKSSNISWEKLGRYIILKPGKRFFSVYGRIYDK